MAIRAELVLEDAKKALEKINQGAGYVTTVRTVSRDFFPLAQLNSSDLPALFVTAGPETHDVEFETEIDQATLEFSVHCFVEARSGMSTVLNALMGDVHKALRADPTRGGNASDTVPAGTWERDEETLSPISRAAARMIYAVRYQHTIVNLE